MYSSWETSIICPVCINAEVNGMTINEVWPFLNSPRGVRPQYCVTSTIFELRTYIHFRHLYLMRQTLLCLHEVFTYFLKMYFYNYIVLFEFFRATQLMEHAGCFSVSIRHRTLKWTTGSLTCAQLLMHAIAHGGGRTPQESLH